MKQQQYSQPQKNEVRTKSLTHAVEILTSKRELSLIVPKDYVRKVRDFLIRRDISDDKLVASICTDQLCTLWELLWESKNGKKTPESLLVAYLAGPEPLNDFNELVRLGIHPYNIFAFESETKIFNEALSHIKNSHFPLLKIIPTSIDTYLQSVPCQFDIIYIDACGPIPSSNQRTTRTIANIFRYQRLTSPGVLITNFATPDLDDETQLNSHSELVSTYLYPKSSLESDNSNRNLDDGAEACGYLPKIDDDDELFEIEDSFFHEVKNNFPKYYGQYIQVSYLI
ncbi:MAG: hypothetical protein VSS75_012500 [Candidatus Parabeggiatoa sp.]|nr:hypothetical protein [Candidatus Parabeggiatoa sp.]